MIITLFIEIIKYDLSICEKSQISPSVIVQITKERGYYNIIIIKFRNKMRKTESKRRIFALESDTKRNALVLMGTRDNEGL